MQLINIFWFKLGYFLYPEISVSLFQWPFPKYREHTALVTDIFPTEMENDVVCIHSYRSELQPFSISIYSVYYQSFLG